MLAINATEARKNWSEIIDQFIRKKPQFIRRTKDCVVLADVNFLELILDTYKFSAKTFEEEDGSATISLNEMDLVENGETFEVANINLANSILEYAEEFYADFDYWGSAPNRVKHIPYVFKALIINDSEKIGDLINCQIGKI